MLDILSNLHIVYWHWLTFAIIMLILELLTGGGFLFWTGISATAVAAVLWLVPALNTVVQLIGFAILTILTAVFWALYLKKNPITTDKPALNRRGEQYIGRVFTLVEPVVNGIGTVRVDDTTWRVRCTDLPVGAKIKITDVDGVILIAIAASASE